MDGRKTNLHKLWDCRLRGPGRRQRAARKVLCGGTNFRDHLAAVRAAASVKHALERLPLATVPGFAKAAQLIGSGSLKEAIRSGDDAALKRSAALRQLRAQTGLKSCY